MRTKTLSEHTGVYKYEVDFTYVVVRFVEYEKSLHSNVDLNGMLQGATVHGEVHIHINTSK